MKLYKKTLLDFTLLSIVLAGSYTSCQKRGNDKPTEISFTEYTLQETPCHWTNLINDNKVIIINSDEEFEKYITCTNNDNGYPAINFSKYTLLLVSGETPNGVSNISKELQQFSINKYKLNIKITLNDATVAQGWNIAVLINKLSIKSSVVLNVTIIKN